MLIQVSMQRSIAAATLSLCRMPNPNKYKFFTQHKIGCNTKNRLFCNAVTLEKKQGDINVLVTFRFHILMNAMPVHRHNSCLQSCVAA